MNNYVIAAGILIVASVGLVLLIRRNLRQRVTARRFREIFIAIADDLVAKPDFPAEHARQLVNMSALPEGWLTRFMVWRTVVATVVGERKKAGATYGSVKAVPKRYQAQYVKAIFAFVLSDSYRCALLGRVVRGTIPWLWAAVEEVKPDVNAHATQSIVARVSQVHPSKRLEEKELVCA